MPTLKVNKKLEYFIRKHKPLKVAIGGRGSGKSIGFGDIFTMKMETERADIYCLREYQESIADSVHRVFEGSIRNRLNLIGWDIQKNTVVAPNGAQTRYKGAARSPDAIQSAQEYKYSWFEEAQRASEDSLDKLIPTIIRIKGAECWFSANPYSSNDPFSKRFINPFQRELERNGYYEDDIHLIVVLNWRDNPWWNEEQEQIRAWDYENLSRAKYDWIWEGKFYDTTDNSIIQPEWFDAAIDAHVKLGFEPKGAKVASHDPSDNEGKADPRGYILRHGSVILEAEENDRLDVNDACDWAMQKAIDSHADHFVWDCDGMGITLKRQVREYLDGKHIDYHLFKGSEGVEMPEAPYLDLDAPGKNQKNKDVFKNKRAQYYIKLRDRFKNTYRAVSKKEYVDPDKMISISSSIKNIPALRAQICRIPSKPNSNGMIQILSKPEMKSMGIDSPNMADCAMMSLIDASALKKKDFNFIPQPTKNYW